MAKHLPVCSAQEIFCTFHSWTHRLETQRPLCCNRTLQTLSYGMHVLEMMHVCPVALLNEAQGSDSTLQNVKELVDEVIHIGTIIRTRPSDT